MDLIIYDGYFNSRIILEGGTGLFPIECVYGFVEVKSLLKGAEIEKFTETVRIVRDLASEKRYVTYPTRKDDKGHNVVDEIEIEDALPPRSFLFAINCDYADIGNVETALKHHTEKTGAHVHGLAVLDDDWFIHQRATFGQPSEFIRIAGGALTAFCTTVLMSIQSIKMFAASMSRYWGG